MNPKLRRFLCPPTFRQWMWSLGRSVVGGYLLLGLVAGFPNSLVFHPPGHRDELAGQVKLHSADGNTITGLLLPNPSAAYVLLYSYGNGEELFVMQDFMRDLQHHGWAVMGYDYPGYGTSTGTPTEAGCDAAIDAAYAWLTNEKHISPARIVLYGHSLGSGPSVDLASRQPAGGLILDGAYTSIFRVVTHYRILPWDMFNNLAKISSVHVPLLSLHGTADPVVPFWHGQALYDAYTGPKQHFWVTGGGHGNLPYVAPEAYWGALEQYRQSLPLKDPIKF
jgi:abhydrolase domain-containing protein 17